MSEIKEKALAKLLEELNQPHDTSLDRVHNWICDQEDEELFKGILKERYSLKCALSHAKEKARKFAEDTRTYREGELVGFIYKITQKETGRVYIGKTVNHPIFRWFQHFKAQSDSYFHEVMKDSDITDWTYEVIDVLKEGSGKDLLELESKYIAEYNATDREYGFNTKN